MILRTTYDGTGDGEGVAEDRRFYYCQNWPDVSVIPDDAGIQQERVFYSPYGQPFGMAAGGTNFDGNFDIADGNAASENALGWNALTSGGVDGVNRGRRFSQFVQVAALRR